MDIPAIQQQILHKAMISPTPQRYRDLRPEQTANDLYNYHLRSLCTQGLLHKATEGYTLTFSGKQFVEEKLPLGTLRPVADTFKVYAHAIIINKHNPRQVLSRQRLREPFYGDRGIHGVSVRRGETTFVAVQRHHQERLDILLNPEHSRLHGIVRKINTLPDGTLFSDMIHYLFICSDYQGDPQFIAPTARGISWRAITKAVKDEQGSPTPLVALATLLQHIAQNTLTPQTFIHDEEQPVLQASA